MATAFVPKWSVKWSAGRPRPARSLLLLSCVLAACTLVLSQTHATVRHYKERVDDTPPEIAQAEDAIQKGDFADAESLLKKALDKDPNNFQAWFDLGFTLNRLGRADESIAAYRKSVAAKPDVFESNLNLGLMLVRANHPDAEQCWHWRISSKTKSRKRQSPRTTRLLT
jgi:Flp pilus assembly protein TadD